METSYNKFQQNILKRAYMVNHYSCWTYENNQVKFIKLKHFANKLVFIWLCKMKVILERKNMFQLNYNTHL